MVELKVEDIVQTVIVTVVSDVIYQEDEMDFFETVATIVVASAALTVIKLAWHAWERRK